MNFDKTSKSKSKISKNEINMLIACPNGSSCKEYIPKPELDDHLIHCCQGTVISCVNSNAGCSFRSLRRDITSHEWQCPFKRKSPESSLTSITLSSTSSVFHTDATGVSVNGSQPDVQNINNHTGNSSKAAGFNPHFQHNNIYTQLNHVENTDLINEDLSITLPNPERLDFGISYVGGFDTPLQCIVIQEIFRDGLVAIDGRLRPGDQLIKVNEYHLSRVNHHDAREILNRISQSGDTLYLSIHRDTFEKRGPPICKEEILTFNLEKLSNKKMGLKLAAKTNKPGLFIQEVLPDSQAFIDGRLKKEDRILKINDVDLEFGTQDEALAIIKTVRDSVCFAISRIIRPQTPDIIRATASDTDGSAACIATSSSYPGLKNVSTFGYRVNSPQSGSLHHYQVKSTFREEVVEVDKKSGESLGMSVAGGVNSQRGDTPVYITNIAPNSLLKKTNGIDKGDILLAVNETELLGLSHERAVEALRLARDNCNKVTVRVLKIPYVSITPPNDNFIPSWMYWLKLPCYCQIPRVITLTRDFSTGSLGFSIVGGNDLVHVFNPDAHSTSPWTVSVDSASLRDSLYRPIMIKSILFGSSAHNNGRLKNVIDHGVMSCRCGDILISINEIPLTNVSHIDAVNLFKTTHGSVQLKVVSWPGTIV